MDYERAWGFASKKYTGVNSGLSLIGAIILTILFYLMIWPFSEYGFLDFSKYEVSKSYAWTINMFFPYTSKNRSFIPIFTMLFAFWSVSILYIKSKKLLMQNRALELALVPQSSDFVLAPSTSTEIINKMYEKVDDPKKFLLLNRIERALSNLKNIGRISDVAEVLTVQSENDDNYMESTYTLIKGFIWAIPVLGFIGTVLGLSQAVGGFGNVVAAGADVETLKKSLSGVTSGLAVAFETTYIALVAALFIQLWLTMIKKKEEDFLDECSDYCHRNIITKLRIVELRDEFNKEVE
jgi:biopolymer transport protein ExbB/TolQ